VGIAGSPSDITLKPTPPLGRPARDIDVKKWIGFNERSGAGLEQAGDTLHLPSIGMA
jgi:hypothetical protein